MAHGDGAQPHLALPGNVAAKVKEYRIYWHVRPPYVALARQMTLSRRVL